MNYLLSGVIATFMLFKSYLPYRSYSHKQNFQLTTVLMNWRPKKRALQLFELSLSGEEQERTRLAKDYNDGLEECFLGIKYSFEGDY